MMVCKCGKGYASPVDGICKFCRENLLSRSIAKRIGIKNRGDGLDLHTMIKYHEKLGLSYPKGASSVK